MEIGELTKEQEDMLITKSSDKYGYGAFIGMVLNNAIISGIPENEVLKRALDLWISIEKKVSEISSRKLNAVSETKPMVDFSKL